VLIWHRRPRRAGCDQHGAYGRVGQRSIDGHHSCAMPSRQCLRSLRIHIAHVFEAYARLSDQVSRVDCADPTCPMPITRSAAAAAALAALDPVTPMPPRLQG
jgi:hypothetical protein